MINIAGTAASHAIDRDAVVTKSVDAPGSRIDLYKPFSQSLTCYAGIKPYFNRMAVGPRTISFDGDQLVVSGGGHVNSGRFSASGHDIERTNGQTSALLQTRTGSSNGRLWLERDLTGALVSAGIVHRAGADRVECGDRYASEWLDDDSPKPFGRNGKELVWQSAPDVALKCVRYEGTDLSAATDTAPEAARLQLVRNGALRLTLASDTDAIVNLSQAAQSNRTASFVHETVRDGGQRVWISRRDTDGETDAIKLRFRFNYNLLDLELQRADQQNIRCVPAPLDPREFVDS